ncbi:hypothetical protein [Bathymodiolus japonicus methanotrophic gill symbiont]|uniref:hypothetical protein n=1 Tax=Bathymodiolus japonicus methanotrophic gill symbiont TaxID=113269 RepID=UPI001C8F10A7|nr:hypothetical protein [Bathymodiolus japonicus methanotrophic gill symbiont]
MFESQEYQGDLSLFDFSIDGVASGNYPIYQVVTQPGTDPLDFRNWIGGLAGLSVINFSIGLPVEVTKDYNHDGFSDDDFNKDGFH